MTCRNRVCRTVNGGKTTIAGHQTDAPTSPTKTRAGSCHVVHVDGEPEKRGRDSIGIVRARVSMGREPMHHSRIGSAI